MVNLQKSTDAQQANCLPPCSHNKIDKSDKKILAACAHRGGYLFRLVLCSVRMH